MTCLIIDDNAMARTALRHLISDIDSLDLRAECEDAMQAMKYLQQQAVDLLFLDVEMPHMNGLELLQVLPQRPLVILVTSKREYAVEAFDLQVVDYLVKPITLARLLSAVQRAQEMHQNKNRPLPAGPGLDEEHIFFKANNTLVRVQLNDILYFQALGDYVTLTTKEKRYTLYTKMKTIEDRLPVSRYIRTHRSYIVAIGKIDNIEDNSIQIGRHLIPISDSYRARVMAQLNFL
ncbi:LytR/AlgR family response regulator transcription factor [Flavilitoribacter nigricans]|uniref:DNA-binding response regulator n=1 Tax=Flavilitoribacter nigricans (strain ATCC 23147 / DSM 23189 / NBRC 102662 / NCIMB 1420 / SS-2) TaxID=1122177 RepID=A0A2D0N864_FLAN2|nr:LytTR family DNA-binding domain-containing protein [Flavilitoribacter nigricans]PHN04702.1 DNA-binding response regulator [Flavilitoribacter nigricans DSM 23189 = NBRC 102662]